MIEYSTSIHWGDKHTREELLIMAAGEELVNIVNNAIEELGIFEDEEMELLALCIDYTTKKRDKEFISNICNTNKNIKKYGYPSLISGVQDRLKDAIKALEKFTPKHLTKEGEEVLNYINHLLDEVADRPEVFFTKHDNPIRANIDTIRKFVSTTSKDKNKINSFLQELREYKKNN